MRFLVCLAAAATAAGHQALLQTGALSQHGAHAEGGHLGLLQNRRLKPGSVPHDVQRHAAAGLEVLWQPHAVDRAAAESEAEPFRYVLSPELLGIPEGVRPEDYFQNVLLPRVPPESGRQFVVDVGANVGQFAAAMAQAGVDGVSFEPAPATCRELEANIAAAQLPGAGRVQAVCAAVGANEGTVLFSMPNNTASTSFREVSSSSESTVEVPVVTLDSAIGSGQGILLLKTDTQGREMDVLAGARALLTRKAPRLLLVELSHYLLMRSGSSPLELMETIAGYGYVCTHLAYHGRNDTGQFEIKHLPSEVGGARSFEEMASLLRSMPTQGGPGWTDLLCW